MICNNCGAAAQHSFRCPLPRCQTVCYVCTECFGARRNLDLCCGRSPESSDFADIDQEPETEPFAVEQHLERPQETEHELNSDTKLVPVPSVCGRWRKTSSASCGAPSGVWVRPKNVILPCQSSCRGGEDVMVRLDAHHEMGNLELHDCFLEFTGRESVQVAATVQGEGRLVARCPPHCCMKYGSSVLCQGETVQLLALIGERRVGVGSFCYLPRLAAGAGYAASDVDRWNDQYLLENLSTNVGSDASMSSCSSPPHSSDRVHEDLDVGAEVPWSVSMSALSIIDDDPLNSTELTKSIGSQSDPSHRKQDCEPFNAKKRPRPEVVEADMSPHQNIKEWHEKRRGCEGLELHGFRNKNLDGIYELKKDSDGSGEEPAHGWQQTYFSETASTLASHKGPSPPSGCEVCAKDLTRCPVCFQPLPATAASQALSSQSTGSTQESPVDIQAAYPAALGSRPIV